VSRFDRAWALERLAGERFDVLVVGGGITGAGVALDAASRGLKTALVERADFASGTSSKSSKLVHGGLRYLQQGEIGLVHESLVERRLLLENAPHLVSPLPFVVPVFGRGRAFARPAARSVSTGLWLYDLLGGWRSGGRHRRIGPGEALAHLPRLRTERLAGGFSYLDAHTDDARLTLAVVRTAVLDHDAVAANYAGVTAILTDADGRAAGARVSPSVMPGTSGSFGDAAVGPDFDVHARVVVNATGVWADEVRALAEDGRSSSLRPAKGVHLTVPAAALPCDAAAVLPVRGERRTIFVVPWPDCDMTYVGTTDTDYDGPLDAPPCTPDDLAYLLGAVNASTTATLGPRDVTAVWAGLRPLLAATGGRRPSARTADLSRRHAVRTSADGVVTVTGGKLTTYRAMAEDTMRQVLAVLGGTDRHPGPCRTRHLRLRGAPPRASRSEGDHDARDRLWDRYGTEADAVRAMARDAPGLDEPLAANLPYTLAEVLYAVREEMAQSLEDVLARRTRAVLQDARAAVDAARPVADAMAAELGWTSEQASEHVERFCAGVRADLGTAGVPSGEGARR
jgi:glycerol-3-phosphate dehydrogenase